MRLIGSAAQEHLAQKTTNLATCWLVVRPDGQSFGFTDHHENLTIGGILYEHGSGVGSNTTYEQTSTGSPGNVDAVCLLDSTVITYEDMLAGLWNGSAIYIGYVNYLEPDSFTINLLRGKFGEITTVSKNVGRVEIRTLTQLLKNRIGKVMNRECAYVLGDAGCGVNLLSYRVQTTIHTVDTDNPQNYFAVDNHAGLVQTASYYALGKIHFTSGGNEGLWAKIKNHTGLAFQTFLDLPFALSPGDTLDIYPGCDGMLATCNGKFSNYRYLGFPNIPGTDFMTSFPDAVAD
jgi:uncharacterized phage protein (TIGR02218 family)